MPPGGLIYVYSRLKDSSNATEDQYHDYYDNELIAEIFRMQPKMRPEQVLRYRNVSSTAQWPFLVLAPVNALSMLYSPIQRQILARVRDKPSKAYNNDLAHDHVVFQTRNYRQSRSSFPGGLGLCQSETVLPMSIICDSVDLVQEKPTRSKVPDDEQLFNESYRTPWLDGLGEYLIGSTFYKNLDGSGPRYLVIHEFDCQPSELCDVIDEAEVETAIDRQVFGLLSATGLVNWRAADMSTCSGVTSAP